MGDCLLVPFRQAGETVSDFRSYRGTAKLCQVFHHLYAIDGHDSRQDRNLDVEFVTSLDEVEEVAIVIEIVGDDKISPVVYFELEVF